jgi:hypothetical protein
MTAPDWLFWAITAPLVLAGLALLYLGMFHDRARGRRRCPKCWYDMSATEGLRCPECGKTARNERKLHKTHRKKRWVAVALLLWIGAAAGAMWPTVHREGWDLVPTRLLVELVPIGGYNGPFGQELMGRFGMTGPRAWMAPNTISSDDMTYVVTRLGNGNWLARPMSERWKSSYGRVIRELCLTDRIEVSEVNLVDALREWYTLPPELSLRTRKVWPEGYSLWVESREQTWWPWPTYLSVAVRRAGAGGDYQEIRPWQGFLCPESEAGTGVIHFEATLTQCRQGETPGNDDSQMPRLALEGRQLDVPYCIGGSIDQILTPVRSAEVDAMLRCLAYEGGEGSASVNFWDMVGGPVEGLALGLMLEFRLDGELMLKQRVWWDGTAPQDRDSADVRMEFVRVEPEPANFKSPWEATPAENWTIIIKSDPEMALRVIDRDRYWEGEVQIRLQTHTPSGQ